MKKYILLIAALLFIPYVAWSACTGESPTWTCTYDTAIADIQTCVTAATIGDTINITAGTATWTTALTVTKGLKIYGAGIDSTIIGNSDSVANNIITYAPSDTTADDLFEVKDFTFNLNIATTSAAGRGIYLYHTDTNRMKNIRIHHNKFINQSTGQTYAIYTSGLIYPLIDNNTFTLSNLSSTTANISFKFLSGNTLAWDNYKPSYAATDLPYRVYIEDNYFENRVNIISSGHGARYVVRYNTLAFTKQATISPVFDAHGNQDNGIYGTQVAEIYGNKLYHIDGLTINSSRFFDHRGGLGLVFYNQLDNFGSSTDMRAVEETDDAISPVNYVGPNAPQVPQHVSDAYYWSSRLGSNPLPVAEGADVTNVITENVTYFRWNGTTAFDGTKQTGAGVGCGTLAARPETCTTGVAYWAVGKNSDGETDQSCSDLTGMVGTNPTNKIAGSLYKCVANAWEETALYTPYDYPHPLRLVTGGGEEEPPIITVTVSHTGDGVTMSHDGASSVMTGGSINISATRYNGWNGAWSGTCPLVTSCTVPDQGQTAVCSVTPTEACTVTYTATQINILN